MSPTQAIKAAFIIVLASFLISCGGKDTVKVKSDLHIKGAPDWVNKGTQALKDKSGRRFHGVGFAPDLGDISLQKSTADNRARAEVARILSSYMEIVSNDFVSSSGTENEKINEQKVSREIKNLTEMNLAGVRIIGRWRNKKDLMMYSLAELDMKHVKQAVNTYRTMNEDFRGYLDRNADTTFDKVSEDSQ